MFSAVKPAASLSSGLLARKGQARPAMRPQGFIGLDPATMLEDLGWNDMGQHAPVDQLLVAPEADAPVSPALVHLETLAQEFPTEAASPFMALEPEVESVAADDGIASLAQVQVRRRVSNATAARIEREVAARGAPKAAFTLRLDPDRHLKLRLASAVTGKSAQLLVTQALDALLESLPEIDTLMDHLPSAEPR